MTAVKRRPRCGQVKPAEAFYWRQRTRLSSYCRACQRAAAWAAGRRLPPGPGRRRSKPQASTGPVSAATAPWAATIPAVVTPHEAAVPSRPARRDLAGAASSGSWWWAGRAGRGDGAGGAGRPLRPRVARPGRRCSAGDRRARASWHPAGFGVAACSVVAFALAQRGKLYRWGGEGLGGFDCSGLTWRPGDQPVMIPWTAAGQLAGLPRVRGRLRPGDLVIYRSDGPSRRHVAIVVGRGRMVEALGRGILVRFTRLRGGWLGGSTRAGP